MKHILLDTNVLMAVVQFKIDIFTELRRICDFNYQLSVLDMAIDELKRIKRDQKQSQKLAASVALQLIEKNNISIIRTDGSKYTDDLLADYSMRGYIVATQDAALKKRLKHQIITIRKKKYLVFV